MTQLPVLAEAVRSGFVEGHHRGSVVGLDTDGSIVLAVGDVDIPIFPRSANKPLQAAGMLHAGLDLREPQLALAAASHSGEPVHVAGVREMLADADLGEDALGCPAELPRNEQARADWLLAGRGPRPVAMNCSGKHAAMLATCVVNDWPVVDYLAAEHPLQVAIRKTFEQLTEEPVVAVGVDGCGAPLFATTLTALARSFRRFVLAAPGTAERQVADAMRAHPRLVSGTGRDEAELMGEVPGLLAKSGAEAVYAAALPDGRAVALKIDDGGQRARPPVMMAALRRLGLDGPVLDRQARTALLGGGRRVGEVRATPFWR